MSILYNCCPCAIFTHMAPLVTRMVIFFYYYLLPTWIQFWVLSLWGGKKSKPTTKITCASPITIPLLILSPTATRDLPLANSQTTHLLPGLCCKASFFITNTTASCVELLGFFSCDCKWEWSVQIKAQISLLLQIKESGWNIFWGIYFMCFL